MVLFVEKLPSTKNINDIFEKLMTYLKMPMCLILIKREDDQSCALFAKLFKQLITNIFEAAKIQGLF